MVGARYEPKNRSQQQAAIHPSGARLSALRHADAQRGGRRRRSRRVWPPRKERKGKRAQTIRRPRGIVQEKGASLHTAEQSSEKTKVGCTPAAVKYAAVHTSVQ